VARIVNHGLLRAFLEGRDPRDIKDPKDIKDLEDLWDL
jgi:hypothetical protein